jgi:hypothetical protein
MTEPSINLSNEQFHELLDRVVDGRSAEKQSAAGLGSLAGLPGLGCGDGDMGALSASVYTMLANGSPRLALAKAMGLPLAPYMINVRATFPDTATSNIPEVGSDVKITQDTLIETMLFRISNQSTTANQNVFQVQSDWYYNFQSSIEATLDVTGAPRYGVTAKFMPLVNLCDAFNGSSKPGAGWILTYQQQLKMSFNAKVTLPYAPMEVVVTFRALVPVWDELVQMTNREAFVRLRELGFNISDAYAARCCR